MLWIGEERDCVPPSVVAPLRRPGETWGGIVHAAKYPCHADYLGYRGKGRAAIPSPRDPAHLAVELPGHLILNMIDPPIPDYFSVELFARALDFICARIDAGPVLIHCNQGRSRAPSLALIYLAKRRGVLPDASYTVAREGFLAKFPRYEPGPGIATFLTERWGEIR